MKNLILASAFALFSFCGFSQKIGIKLNSPQTFTVVPAVTASVDSISVGQIIDDGVSVIAEVVFIKTNGMPHMKRLILWEGQAYRDNQNWTRSVALARIKLLLGVK